MMNLKASIEAKSQTEVMACHDFESCVESIEFESFHEIDSIGEPGYSVEDGVATIKVRGLLVPDLGFDLTEWGITGYDVLSKYIENANEELQVNRIVLDVDSPGGFVKGLSGAVSSIMESAKPIDTFVSGNAYSAAYWIASAANKIVAVEDGGVGSIGVYVEHTDRSEQLAMNGIKRSIFKSGFWKGAFSSSRPLSEREEERLQSDVNETAQTFFEHVAERRNLEATQIAAMDGDVFNVEQALTNGLIDSIEGNAMTDKITSQAATQAANNDGPDQSALEAAREEGRKQALAEVKAEADRIVARNKAIYANANASDDIKEFLASDAFASVPVESLTELMDKMPKGFAAVMDEEGGAGVEADPTDITPKSDSVAKAEANAKAVGVLKDKGKVL